MTWNMMPAPYWDRQPAKGATITHQAIEHIRGGHNGRDLTRCWSKWTDGTVTLSDSAESERATIIGGIPFYYTICVNFGLSLPPPHDLEWIDTVAALREVDAERQR